MSRPLTVRPAPALSRLDRTANRFDRESLRQAARAAVEPLEGRLLFATIPEDVTPPGNPNISVSDITSAGGTDHTVTVTYTDDFGIDDTTIDTGDIDVNGPGGGSLNVTGVSKTIDGTTVTATYTFDARGGTWSDGDNGDYTVQVKSGEVFDFNSHDVPSASKTFTVDIPVPDTEPPAASIGVNDVSAGGGTSHTITVTYTDNEGIDTSTIGSNDITVTRSGGGALDVVNVDVNTSDGGRTATVTYTVEPPGGSWDAADNDDYDVNVNGGSVRDTSDNGVGSPNATFAVSIATPDTTPPAAVITAGNVTAAGNSYTVTVDYTDNQAVDQSTIGNDDITATGPGGALAVTGVTKAVSDGGRRVVATYALTPPGGTWNAADNGDYTVTLAAGAVSDTAGNPVAGDTDGFTVTVPVPDTTKPQADISVGNIGTAGNQTHTVRITYTDNGQLNANSVGTNDITVTGPLGTLNVSDVDTSVENGGKRIVATYTVEPPVGGWSVLTNGEYTVTLKANAVADATGNGVNATTDDFDVNIAIIDTDPPTAEISVGDVNAPGGATHSVTVVYRDNRNVRVSTLGDDDIVVTGPGGITLPVVLASKSSDANAPEITATYTITAPGGAWGPEDNGEYTVTVVAGKVKDAASNNVAQGADTFGVAANPSDGAPPAASIEVGNLTTAGDTQQTVVVTYTDDVGIDASTINADDLSVTGPAGTLSVNSVVVSSSNGGKTATATYTLGAPSGGWTFSHNGTYTVTVKTNQVRDLANKPAPSVNMQFTVAIPAPGPVDPTFGNGTGVNTSFTTEAITTQPDGMIVVAGRQGAGATSQGVLQRINAAGLIDSSFGNNGRIVTGNNEAFYAVAMQGDKILVAGKSSSGDFLLVRYKPDGTLDETFAGGGRVVADLGAADDAAYGLAFAPDGKIVLAGGSGGNYGFARFDANGALDLSFGQRGMDLFDLGAASEVPGAVGVTSDGKIVAAGSSGTNVAIVRLNPNGGADGSFSGDGLLMVGGLHSRDDASAADRSQALAIQPDGRILISNHTAEGNFAIARIDANGNLDSSFGNGGIATADFGGDDDADALLVQDTGEILVIGTSLNGGNARTTVAAFNASGQLIDGFGEGGKLTLGEDLLNTGAGRELHVGDLVIRAFGARQSDGRLVVGASNGTPTQQGSALTRLIVPGTRNAPNGALIGSFGVVNGRNQRLSVTDPDGKVTLYSIKGGTASAFANGDRVDLVITDDGRGAAVSIKVKGGNGRLNLGDVTVNGSLKSIACKTGDLFGTMSIGGVGGKLTLGNITGTIAAGGSIASIAADNLIGAQLLAGTSLGSDRALGGNDADADAFGGGSIGSLKVKGRIEGSLIGAGLNPVDGTYGNDNDTVVGGIASFIKSISAKGGADDGTTFIAGAFKSAKLGGKVKIAEDPRFRILA